MAVAGRAADLGNICGTNELSLIQIRQIRQKISRTNLSCQPQFFLDT